MSAAWLVRTLLIGVLFSIAAIAASAAAEQSGRPRRWAWLSAMGGSALLPVLALLVPGAVPNIGLLPNWPLQSGSEDTLHLSDSFSLLSGELTISASRGMEASGIPWMGSAWAFASIGMMMLMVWTYIRLNRISRKTAPALIDGYHVWVGNYLGPAVFGLIRPRIVVPCWVMSLPEDQRRLVIAHEDQHLQNGDSWLLFVSSSLLASMPWNPLLWWQHSRLRFAIEADCDARLLASGFDRKTYGRVLLQTAGEAHTRSLLAPAWGRSRSHLEQRIRVMTRNTHHRKGRASLLLAAAIVTGFAACDLATTEQPTAPESVDPVTSETSGSETSIGSLMDGGSLPDDIVYYLDGSRVQSIGDVDVQDIAHINVIKNVEPTVVKVTTWDNPAAKELVGPDAKRPGSLRTESVDGDKETIRFTLRDGESGDANPLGGDYPPIIFIDGVRSDRATVDEIDPNTIDTIEVLKGDKAVEEYGDEAKGGVIKVFRK